ncbi:hypothetical protein [Novosphingobium sp. BL-52-GroH]|uniref:hypothetical protein n=1 Tax=Novosphingobium sp. BL-52-GroH TaxID=3349877 RepID=UPI00384CF2A2
MATPHDHECCQFLATVCYLSGNFIYACETFELEAPDPFEAERLARDRAAASNFHNLRGPELSVEVTVEDRPVPEDDPPPAPPGAVQPVCPRCGSADIICEACAHWDRTMQAWVLGSTYDSERCLACDAQGDLIARWEAVKPQGDMSADLP